MKIKKEYFILAIVMVSLILYLMLRESDRTHYRLPAVPGIDGKRITKIEIFTPDESIALSKKDDKWFIAPKAYLADSSKVQSMLNVIESLTVTAMVSSSKNYDRYDLSDDRKISIKAWGGNSIDREFDIGKSASTFQHTHVRLPEDPNVYHAKGNFRFTFDNKSENLRDLTVLSFDTEDIREIHIGLDNKTIQVSRTEVPVEIEKPQTTQTKDTDTTHPHETKSVWQTAEGKNVDDSKVKQVVAYLSELDCERYVEGKTKEAFQDPIYSITMQGAEEYTLLIFTPTEGEEKSHPAASSQNDYPFILSDFKVNNIKKKIEEMLP